MYIYDNDVGCCNKISVLYTVCFISPMYVNMATWEEYLTEHYFDPNHPGAFAGPYKLHKILHNIGKPVSYHKVKEWIRKQDSYTLLQPVKYKFPRQRVITQGIDDLWDVDLADVSNIGQYNDDIHYLLIVIDVFSKYLWAEPLKNKDHASVIQAFQAIFDRTPRRPKLLRSDKGKEFTNRWVKQFLKKEGIHAYTTKNETKANFAERVIRTLKGLMYRYFQHKQSYVLPLQELVNNYNHRPHKTLQDLAPAQITKKNEAKVWKRMYVDTIKLPKKIKPYKFKVGDKVRISHLKWVFQRDYQEKWTEEVFLVTHRCRKSSVNLYRLKDFLDEPIDGHFYEEELQKVTKDDDALFKVEKVLKTRTRQGQKEYFVKWLGYPKKFNSWIKETDIQLL